MVRSDGQGRRVFLGLMLGLLGAGCGGEAGDPDRTARRPVSVDEVPASVREAAQKALPDIQFEDAWRNVDGAGALRSYELRGRSKTGQIREVKISTTGEVLEME